ncbi:MAG: glycosyltransferase family 4 protein [Thermoanaerobaculia bacterium]
MNTFPPVVPLYDDVFPLLRERGFDPIALISSCKYRSGSPDNRRSDSYVELWVPWFLRKNKRVAAVFYWLFAPFYLLFADAGLIVFLSQPPMLYAMGALVAGMRRKPYFLHVMDLYPDLILKDGVPVFTLIRGVLQRMSIRAFKGAERVIVLGRCMAEVLQSRGVDPSKISIVENWPPSDIGKGKGDSSLLRAQYRLADKLVVMYAGNMGRFHTFDAILRCAEALERREDIVFMFVGGGIRRAEIRAAAKGSDNIILLDHQSPNQFANIVALGDVQFVSLRNGYEGLMVPSKFYTIMASGSAILYEGSRFGEVARVILEEACGSVIDVGDSAALRTQLERYADQRDVVASHGSAAKSAYLKRFDRTALARKYVDLF